MRKLRRLGAHIRWQSSALGILGLLIAAIVCAVLATRSTTSAQPASQLNPAAVQPFAVVLPVVVQLEAGQLFQPSAPVIDTTATPTTTITATLIATPTTTPTLTPSALPTATAECIAAAAQNLAGRLAAPNTGEITNSSASCTYAVGLASYRMFDSHLSHQQLFSSQVALIGPGQVLALTVELPGCAYQLDLFYGRLIETFDPQHGQIYGQRILTTRVNNNPGFCPPGTPTATSIATPSAPPAGSPTSTLTATPTELPTPTATDGPTPTQGGN